MSMEWVMSWIRQAPAFASGLRTGRHHHVRSDHFAVGEEGESIATQYLRTQNYKILDRNVRVGKHDEIDIIAFDRTERVMVFAEVKTRLREDADYRPELNITPEKRHRMSRAARRWIVRSKYDGGYRLDVLCVAAGRVIEHYREVQWG